MHPQLHHIVRHPETRRFGKFAIVGVLNTALDYAIFITLTHPFGINYLISNFFAYLGATINSYYLNRRWTFRSTAANWHREMVKYFIVIGLGFLINEGLLFLLVDKFDLPAAYAKLGVIGVVVFWNYGVNRIWTFRKSLPV